MQGTKKFCWIFKFIWNFEDSPFIILKHNEEMNQISFKLYMQIIRHVNHACEYCGSLKCKDSQIL